MTTDKTGKMAFLGIVGGAVAGLLARTAGIGVFQAKSKIEKTAAAVVVGVVGVGLLASSVFASS